MAKLPDNRPTRKAVTAARDEKFWEFRSKGWTYNRIANELGVTEKTVCVGLQRAAEKHHNSFMADINAYKKAQVKAIEAAAYSALEQYYESQKKKEETTQSGFVQDGKFVGPTTTAIKRYKSNADSKLLGMFFKGMEDIRKIWGIDTKSESKANGKIDVNTLTIEEKVSLFTSIPIDERLNLLDSMITVKQSVPHDVESEKS